MITPIFAMVTLTFIIGIVTIKVRLASIRQGKVSIKYYRVMTEETATVPVDVLKTSRCFSNQFEMPTLFYVVAILYIQFDINGIFPLIFAWLFILFRSAQSYIHLTYNNVLHRASAFWLSCICLLILWLNLAIAIS